MPTSFPAYQQCATDFMAKNPNITVNISQKGWDDYWSGIQNGMIAGNAPDVFTDHLAKYPEFASKGQLVDIQPYVDRDKVDLSVYLNGLADLWGRDGKRYGLPKDWDTISIVYNKDMLDKAGVTVDELNSATWNPEDGGTFAQLIAKLTLDENGKNALDPAFDKTKVAQYGLDPRRLRRRLRPDRVELARRHHRLAPHRRALGHRIPLRRPALDRHHPMDGRHDGERPDHAAGAGHRPGRCSGLRSRQRRAALQGSWMIGDFAKNATFPFGFARLPEGAEGRRSMFNGLADSIWIGTKHPDEAWQWVKYLASADCANVVGDAGVVFPAQQSGVEKAVAAYKAKNLDVSAFTDQAVETDGTFLFPVTDHASEIDALMKPVMESILLGQVKAADVLPAANDQVNALFQ